MLASWQIHRQCAVEVQAKQAPCRHDPTPQYERLPYMIQTVASCILVRHPGPLPERAVSGHLAAEGTFHHPLSIPAAAGSIPSPVMINLQLHR